MTSNFGVDGVGLPGEGWLHGKMNIWDEQSSCPSYNASNEPPPAERGCPNDDHRVSVVSFEDQGSFGVMFCVGLEQDLKRLPWLRPLVQSFDQPCDQATV